MKIEDYVPHRGKMLLIDSLAHVDSESAIAYAVIDSDNLFMTEQGIPASVGIEYMAQTVSAYSNAQSKIKQTECSDIVENLQPNVGLLLGSRRYDSQISHFQKGDKLRIQVKVNYMEAGSISIFDCQIFCNDALRITAILNVLEPNNLADYFELN